MEEPRIGQMETSQVAITEGPKLTVYSTSVKAGIANGSGFNAGDEAGVFESTEYFPNHEDKLDDVEVTISSFFSKLFLTPEPAVEMRQKE